MCVGEARIALELELRRRPSAEIDRRAGERVVHRHDRVAVARDPAAVAERAVERLAERERRVLGRVVRAGLEVADALEHEVEAGVEGELLEEVVVESRRRSATRTRPAPSSPSRTRIRVSAVARQVPHAPAAARRDGRRPVERRARAPRAGGRRPRGRGR